MTIDNNLLIDGASLRTELYNGNCYEILKKIPDNSVDFILTDPPYNTTNAEWEDALDYKTLWAELRRIIKPNQHIAMFSAQPFTSRLINTNFANYKYTWYWLKNYTTGFAYARYQPMRRIEEINIFRFDINNDNTGMLMKCREYMDAEKEKSGLRTGEITKLLNNYMVNHYFSAGSQFCIPSEENYKKLQSTGFWQMPYSELKALYLEEKQEAAAEPFTYNPQGVVKVKNPVKKIKSKSVLYKNETLGNEYTTEYTNWPDNVLEFKGVTNEKRYHPTQKPVDLLEYLINTYTNRGGLVLDCFMGSGSTGVAAVNTGRHFIGIEQDEGYFRTAKKRIDDSKSIIRFAI